MVRIVVIVLSLLLSACSMQPNTQSVKVAVAEDQFVDLPEPAQLQQEVNVSQLISAQWQDNKTQRLLVQLEVDQQKVALAGFSAWGAKLLSISYWGKDFGHRIETQVMSGLADKLPAPEQVLFYVMISIWPEQAWQNRLNKIGWRIQDKPLQRQLFDDKGNLVLVIDYQQEPHLQGTITLKHLKQGYTVTIQTQH